ncbi:hypothetical protein [Roseomonas sp. CECT 9278]|uniref:hypothetical protein n=1 Tax=Roseomonas sp. CECT 9278 TaxID=2845823 RepID=UPI001E4CE580|nr:hypothetical protein [Roseomonas sp. CECT 9278]CAH0260150.1 hypothetical protein ROS9278_03376 [Roseomonas sp. CECT 9278]
MRAVAVIGRDGPDPSRRAVARDSHITAIEGFAREGLLLLGLPLHSPQGRSEGSLMVVAAPHDYLAREPFAVAGVWRDVACRPIGIPSLPWRDWPVEADLPPGRGHTILVLEGEAQPARLAAAAASGLLVFAAETLDRPGAILVTAHRDDAAALAFVGADALLRRCAVTIHATRFRPLPYRPLPRPGDADRAGTRASR